MNTLFKTITDSQLSPANVERETPTLAAEEEAMDFIFVRDLEIEMSIGTLDHEKEKKQRVVVNIELAVVPNDKWEKDDIQNVVSYADIVEKIQSLAGEKHFNLVEVFAEKIAALCLNDPRAQEVSVQIDKPDIYDCAAGVGCGIIRSQARL